MRAWEEVGFAGELFYFFARLYILGLLLVATISALFCFLYSVLSVSFTCSQRKATIHTIAGSHQS